MTHKTMKSNGKHTNRAQIERRDHQGMSPEQASYASQRDFDPCYRRERDWLTRNVLKIRDAGGSQRRFQ